MSSLSARSNPHRMSRFHSWSAPRTPSVSFAGLRYLLHRHGFHITAIATNRVKAVSWLYLPLWPLAAVATEIAFRRWEKDPAQRERNREILRQMLTPAVAFGETLIVKAVRA